MNSYFSSKVCIKESDKGGKGLFSNDYIFKDEVIAIKSGHIVIKEHAHRLDKEIGDFSLQISNEHYICPKSIEEIEDIVLFINHSCNPNIGMDGQISYVAMRDIENGEELCLDYAMAMNDNYYLECHCGSKNCRGVITGYDWKIKDLQVRYDKYFSWYIYKMIHEIE